MARDRTLGKTIFDEVAELYDEARPPYPPELIDDVISLSGIPAEGAILEIGCGTGKASEPFARRGYSLLCLEPGAHLASLARKKLTAYPRAQVQVTTFEDWPLQAQAYDLVIVADAFKWITPEVRYSKSATALKPCGALAIFRNADASRYADSPFFRELQRIYERCVPPADDDAPGGPSGGSVAESGEDLFAEIIERRYPWSVTYDTRSYLNLLHTYSDHRLMPEEVKRRLFAAIAALIEEHGGTLTKSYVAVLRLARKAATDRPQQTA